MMTAKDKGDTCPMIGFDQNEIKKILKIDDQFERKKYKVEG
jgi:putative NAD(P)H nitroreductase